MTEPATPDSPPPRRRSFIDGVYNHCDRWCERCRFHDRCRLFHDLQRDLASMQAGLSSPPAEEADEIEEPDTGPVPDSDRHEWLAILEEANQASLTAEATATSESLYQHIERVGEHELSRAAEEYTETWRGLAGALRPRLRDAGDTPEFVAFETIDHLALSIQGHLWRVASAFVDRLAPGPMVPDDDDEGAVGNGSAKVTRLMLAESRMAWEVLKSSATIATDGVPAAMIQRVDALDALVARYFPSAMAFVRAGFDEDEGPGAQAPPECGSAG